MTVPDDPLRGDIDIDIQRQHARIQVALVLIGLQLGYHIWVAQNDKGIVYNERKIGEIEGVIEKLQDMPIVSAFNNAVRAALFIDCIWFQNTRFMPAVIEIEHTTGVKSGLTRMMGLYNAIPSIQTRYVIVAPDEDRHKVVTEINRPQFRDLEACYFPYSAVEELLLLCKRRKIRGVTQEFLDCYIERITEV